MKTTLIISLFLFTPVCFPEMGFADTDTLAASLVTNLTDVLKYVEDFGRKLNLETPSPLSTNHVTRFIPYRGRADVTGMTILNRFQFVFDVHKRFVNTFYDRQYSMIVLWRAEDILPLIKPSKITEEQAVKMAREYLERLGHSEKDLAPRPSEVHQWRWEPPGASQAEPLPFFTIKWPWTLRPNWQFTIEIDGHREKVTHFSVTYPRQDPPAPDNKESVETK